MPVIIAHDSTEIETANNELMRDYHCDKQDKPVRVDGP